MEGTTLTRLFTLLIILVHHEASATARHTQQPQAVRQRHAVALAQTTSQTGNVAEGFSGQFSTAASATLANLTQELARFQSMVTAQSSQYQSKLQTLDKANHAQETLNEHIEAANKALEGENHALERKTRALALSNKQLRKGLEGMEAQLKTAQALAAAVDDFTAKDNAARGKAGAEDFGDGLDSQIALVEVFESSQTLVDGAKDLLQQERITVNSLQESFEGKMKQGKATALRLLQEHGRLNATHVELQARKAYLLKLEARLQVAHDHMQARTQRMGRFLQQLAGIASPTAGPAAAAPARAPRALRSRAAATPAAPPAQAALVAGAPPPPAATQPPTSVSA